MIWITKDPLSGSLIQYLAKNYKNGSIVSVDMDVVGVTAAYSAHGACVVHFIYSELRTYTTVRICCRNTDYVHVNGH